MALVVIEPDDAKALELPTKPEVEDPAPVVVYAPAWLELENDRLFPTELSG